MSNAFPSWSLPADALCVDALLDAKAIRALENTVIVAGIPENELMERAGAASADAICRRWSARPVLILAGPGNNGGDGFVVARLLAEAGWPVRVAFAGVREKLPAAAAEAAGRWSGAVEPLEPGVLDGAELVIDALFGIGLARPLEGKILETVDALNRSTLPVVAIDMPSGVDSDTGAILGDAIHADMTVTFFRRKPGHLLLPGRDMAGEVVVSELDIGGPVFQMVPAEMFANSPALWRTAFPWPTSASHKYTRGHALVLGGTAMTGAARLAAHAAQRIGAGMVTIAADPAAIPIFAGARADWLTMPVSTVEDFRALLADRRRNAVLLGPGSGADARLVTAMDDALDGEAALVFDADCFSVLADRSNGLLQRLNERVVLTPHMGEFERVFGKPAERVSAAREVARETGATILLKGSDTIVAAPDGKVIVNQGAPPTLATAGAGDVLAGLILGMLANRLPPLLAAAIGCWVHGQAAALFGPGLVAQDLPDLVPEVLAALQEQ